MAFEQRLAELGHVRGRDVLVEARFAKTELLRAVLADRRLVCEPYEDETGRGYRFDAEGVLAFNVGKNSVEFSVASVVSAMVV